MEGPVRKAGNRVPVAAELKGGQLKNSVSIDQLMAARLGDETRFRSLSLSVDGGIGEATRSSTLSFSRGGQPVPALGGGLLERGDHLPAALVDPPQALPSDLQDQRLEPASITARLPVEPVDVDVQQAARTQDPHRGVPPAIARERRLAEGLAHIHAQSVLHRAAPAGRG